MNQTDIAESFSKISKRIALEGFLSPIHSKAFGVGQKILWFPQLAPSSYVLNTGSTASRILHRHLKLQECTVNESNSIPLCFSVLEKRLKEKSLKGSFSRQHGLWTILSLLQISLPQQEVRRHTLITIKHQGQKEKCMWGGDTDKMSRQNKAGPCCV